MTTARKQYSPKFKARVAIEAIRGEKTLNQLGSQFRVHPVQIAHWRKAALEHLEEIFVDGRRRKARDEEVEKEALYEESESRSLARQNTSCKISKWRPKFRAKPLGLYS